MIGRKIGEESETPSPELPSSNISTKHLFFLKYWPTITVALSLSIPIPMAMKDMKLLRNINYVAKTVRFLK